MNRVALFLFLFVSAFQVNAQINTILLTDDNFSRGQKVLLRFSLYLADGTLPNADVFTMQFEDGIDSLEYVTDVFPFDTLPAQVQAVSNPVAGNSMSWGQNTFPGEIGGIQREEYIRFEILAYASDTIGERTKIIFSSSPEGGGGTPEVDSIFVDVVDGLPNLQVNFTGINGLPKLSMYQMPAHQFTYYQPKAQVFNLGRALNEQRFLIFEDEDNFYYSTQPLFNPFLEFGFLAYESPIMQDTEMGRKYNVRAYVDNTADTDFRNNTDSILFQVTDTVLSHTDIYAISNVKTIATDSTVGAILEVIQDAQDGFEFVDTLTSATIFMGLTPGESMHARVYRFDSIVHPNNATLVAYSDTLVSDDGTPQLLTVRFKDTVLISEGKFFLAFYNSDPITTIYGYNDQVNARPNINFTFDNTSKTWVSAESKSGGSLENFMLAANFGDLPIVTGLGRIRVAQQHIKVYPNPVKDKLHVKTEAANFTYHFYDLTGLRRMSGYSSGIIDVQNLTQGMYILRISAPGYAPVAARLVVID